MATERVCSIITDAIDDEKKGITLYYNLLNEIGIVNISFSGVVEDIMEDEKKHLYLLESMARNFGCDI